jgi:hypothetical protein
MNITVKVDDVTLGTVVADVFGYDGESGEPYQLGSKTLADLVADQIVARVVKDERYRTLAERVTEIRTEIIRERVTPAVEEAINGPISKTNHYGERVHGQTTTLRELIAEEAQRALTAPVNRDGYRESITLIQKTVRDEVQKAFAEEIVAAVKQARASVADEIGKQVASAVTNAMKGR